MTIATTIVEIRHSITAAIWANEYRQLVALLTDRSENEVLKKGACERGARQAAGGRLNEHAEAIARGGDLVTLVWALLMHAGTGPSAGPAWSTGVRV
ncbi:uncharacterized protein C2845_PM03G23500 [Panicum miliaceum]|uniref:Uncharacterized protein n=1 Tax=Panicum miliaceum TaxID=4540 RepID=A0A3L6TD52_PANMI|nr:uncharacterized protein C2845_PM03G23500 [Panicum miliaceum]